MTKEKIFDLVINHTCEVIPELKGHLFKNEDRLKDLGANSIDRAEIVTMALESLCLTIPRVELSGVNNIGDLVDLLYVKSQASKLI